MNAPSLLKTSINLCSSLSLALALGGCAKTQSVSEVKTDAQVCDALKNVISKADANFDSLKVGAGVADYDHTRWDTKPIFSGADCDVIRWGAGKTNYACTWTKTDAKDAQKDYAYGLSTAKTCLGAGWGSAPIPGATGEGTRFSMPGNPSVVDIRISQERAPSKGWLTSLTIGAPVNRDAK